MIVKYSRAFPLAAYGINEHIGFEMEIPDSANGLDAVELLRQMAEMSFKNAHPQINLETPVEDVLSKEEIKANNIKAIMDCKTLEELATYKLLKNDKDIFHAYNVKEKELCNK